MTLNYKKDSTSLEVLEYRMNFTVRQSNVFLLAPAHLVA